MIDKGRLGWKLLRALGWRALGWYGVYRLGLWTGHYSRLKPPQTPPSARLRPLWQLPEVERLRAAGGDEAYRALMAEAEDILAGRVRLYGGEPVPLTLTPPLPLRHWTAYEGGRHLPPEMDVKDLWEPARMGWAFVLGRAYRWSGDERFAEAFWRFLEDFDRANPPYLGVNWLSGQEVALRLLALLFAQAVLASSAHSTPERLSRLTAMPPASHPRWRMLALSSTTTISVRRWDCTPPVWRWRACRRRSAGASRAGGNSTAPCRGKLLPTAPTASTRSTTTV